MRTFLKLRGEIFWFRRKLPTEVAEVLGRKEFARSLKTAPRREAESRARLRWVSTERIFQMTKGMSIAKEQALILLRRLAREDPWLPSELDTSCARAMNGDSTHLMSILDLAEPEIAALSRDDQARVLLHLHRPVGQMTSLRNRSSTSCKMAQSGKALGRWVITIVFHSTTRAMIFSSRSRSVSN